MLPVFGLCFHEFVCVCVCVRVCVCVSSAVLVHQRPVLHIKFNIPRISFRYLASLSLTSLSLTAAITLMPSLHSRILVLIFHSATVSGDRRQKPQTRRILALAPLSDDRYVWIFWEMQRFAAYAQEISSRLNIWTGLWVNILQFVLTGNDSSDDIIRQTVVYCDQYSSVGAIRCAA